MHHRRTAIVLLACAAAASAQTLRELVSPASYSAKELAVGDVNGDSLPDALRLVEGGAFLSLGQPDGVLDTPLVIPGLPNPHGGLLADFDDDGLADFALALAGLSQIQVRLSLGDGTFGPPQVLVQSGVSSDLLADEVNGDGKLDLLSSSAADVRVTIYPSQGDGTFGPASYTGAPTGVVHLATGDVDGDGDRDLALMTGGYPLIGNVYAKIGLGGGAFGPTVELDQEARLLDVVDANGDGLDEFVWVTDTAFKDQIVLVSHGASGFLPPTFVATTGAVDAFGVGDVTGDGREDLVLHSAFGGGFGALSVYPQGPAGGFDFQTAVVTALNGDFMHMQVADLDGDGVEDAIATDFAQGIINPLVLQASGEGRWIVGEPDTVIDCAVGDVDGDGRADLIAATDGVPAGSVRRGLPGGIFGSSQAVDLGGPVLRLFADDPDQDGDSDLLVVAPGLAGVHLALAAGGLAFVNESTAAVPFSVVAADAHDVDLDGDLDLLLVGSSPIRLAVLLHDGAGGFTTLPTVTLDTGTVLDVAGADFDGAGFHDAAVLNSLGRVFTVALGPGGGIVLDTKSSGSSPKRLVAGDLDADGFTDVLVTAVDLATSSLRTVFWFRGLGGGKLASPAIASDPLLLTAGDISLVDFGNDGQPELVTTRDEGLYRFSLARPVGGALKAFESYGQHASTAWLRSGDVDGDAFTDLLVIGNQVIGVMPSRLGPWSWLGHSLGGTGGLSRLTGEGPLQPGTLARLTVEGATPAAAASLVVGLTGLLTPFKGGVLVPDAQLVLAGLVTDAEGRIELQGAWPGGVTSGTQIYLQFWMVDAGGPLGFSATGAVRATQP